jgi:RNA polymerase sigma factor (sigma-70 family)
VTDKSDDKLVRILIEGCLKNKLEFQHRLYKHFYSYAMSICLRYAGNRYDAGDILNDGFMKVFTHLDQYDDRKPFHLWLRRIMMNTSIDHYRANLKHRHTTDLDAADTVKIKDDIQQKLNYDDLLRIIQSLSPGYRTVFNLFAIDGYSHEEIAEKLGISVGASKSNLFKARKKLQEAIKSSSDIRFESGHLKIVSINNYSGNLGLNTGTKI